MYGQILVYDQPMSSPQKQSDLNYLYVGVVEVALKLLKRIMVTKLVTPI